LENLNIICDFLSASIASIFSERDMNIDVDFDNIEDDELIQALVEDIESRALPFDFPSPTWTFNGSAESQELLPSEQTLSRDKLTIVTKWKVRLLDACRCRRCAVRTLTTRLSI
jgi:hypothetical protein